MAPPQRIQSTIADHLASQQEYLRAQIAERPESRDTGSQDPHVDLDLRGVHYVLDRAQSEDVLAQLDSGIAAVSVSYQRVEYPQLALAIAYMERSGVRLHLRLDRLWEGSEGLIGQALTHHLSSRGVSGETLFALRALFEACDGNADSYVAYLETIRFMVAHQAVGIGARFLANAIGQSMRYYSPRQGGVVEKSLTQDDFQAGLEGLRGLLRLRDDLAAAVDGRMQTPLARRYRTMVNGLIDDVTVGALRIGVAPTWIDAHSEGHFSHERGTNAIALKALRLGDTSSRDANGSLVMPSSSLLLHEAIHAWQAKRREGQTSVAKEAEAYGMQFLGLLLHFGEKRADQFFAIYAQAIEAPMHERWVQAVTGLCAHASSVQSMLPHGSRANFYQAAYEWAKEAKRSLTVDDAAASVAEKARTFGDAYRAFLLRRLATPLIATIARHPLTDRVRQGTLPHYHVPDVTTMQQTKIPLDDLQHFAAWFDHSKDRVESMAREAHIDRTAHAHTMRPLCDAYFPALLIYLVALDRAYQRTGIEAHASQHQVVMDHFFTVVNLRTHESATASGE